MNIYNYILKSNKSKWIFKAIFLSAFFALSTLCVAVVSSNRVQERMREGVKNSVPAMQTLSKEEVAQLKRMNYDLRPADTFNLMFIILLSVFVSEIASSTLRDRNFHLLPENQNKKFFAAVGMAGLCFILLHLLSVPIEAVEHLIHGSSGFRQIEIGSFLTRLFETPDMILFGIIGFCVSIFIRALVRNKIVYRVLIFICAYYMLGVISNVHMGLETYSTFVCYVSYILPVVLIVASWLLYKRSQIANSGLFMI